MENISQIKIKYGRKHYLAFLFCFVLSFFTSESMMAQVEGLYVETYYIADANDATDTTQGRSLVPGMKTYRIYLDLAEGTRLRKLFGNVDHPLRITSTDVFYNNIDRPNACFGYQMSKAWIDDNPTIALDSWLTLGFGTNLFLGIKKTDDIDGPLLEILNNTGGTAAIPGGLLMNNDPLAGVPLIIADGYTANTTNVIGQWLDVGFKDLFNDDTTVFGPTVIGNEFLSYDASLQQNNGVRGPDTISNFVLIAQLTTLGEISFELNIEVEEFDGNNYFIKTYVANGNNSTGSEIVSPYLTYPPECGCTDPDYLEYSTAYACSLQDSCINLVVFGCMDTLACNYDPQANKTMPGLCCYPGYCYDRDLDVVCPQLSVGRFQVENLHPSPANQIISFSYKNSVSSELVCSVYDVTGKLVLKNKIESPIENTMVTIDINSLDTGFYILIVSSGENSEQVTFVKEYSNH